MPDAFATCPLCGYGECSKWNYPQRCYWHCHQCQLIFLDSSHYLSQTEEKAYYDLHQNSPTDAGYRNFLNQLAEPLIQCLSAGDCGLDFGSGPGPTLSIMLTEAGYPMAIYDPLYAPDAAVFNQHYDFVTASEVVEHLQHPGDELRRLWALLKPGGYFAVMTQLWDKQPTFDQWRYKDDPTHISLFCSYTLQWLAGQWSAKLIQPNRNVALFRKPSGHR